MNDQIPALACLLAPLAGFAVALLAFRRRHGAAAAVVVASGLVSLAAAAWLLFTVDADVVLAARWFVIGETPLEFGVILDGRTLIMGAVVALVTSCIQVYSLYYMAGDPGRGRYFAFLAFFEWAMLSFVYSANLLQTFVFWELVGLSSFLLIGFWYEKPSAVAAAKKAFLMTRVGDVGLFIGLILLFRATGQLDVAAIAALFEPAGGPGGIDQARLELIAMLLFAGVIGKSAQFPLHTWLPDAMEGPTPVSALLHSATMVAAGVFLVVRFHGLFLDAPATMTVMLSVATFTALLSSTMAMVAKDLKRVLAFSSISQLGFMLMGLAAGSLVAGYFHLTTHALFKALLFLCAGAYIHHLGTNDVIAMGRGGAAKLRVATIGLVAGGAALAGVPLFAGFFSKEQIIGALHGPGLGVFMVGAYAAAFLTAYYTFRMVFLIVRPDPGSAAVPDEPAHEHGHGHESPEPAVMRGPILVLAAGAIGAGFLGPALGRRLGVDGVHLWPGLGEMLPALVIVALGIGLAWIDFGRPGAAQTGFVSRVPAVHKLFENRWYVDVIYRHTVVRLAVAVARLCYGTETRGLDGGLDRLAEGTVLAGGATARGHVGRLQLYVGVAVVLVAVIVIFVGVL